MKRPLILGAALLLALAAIGSAAALWSDQLFIEGTVSTGDVDVEWSFVGCFDIEDKDVGTIEAWVDPADPDVLHYQIGNGYPSYTADCEVEYISLGSIPVHVEAITFIPGQALTGCQVAQQTTGSFVASCDQLTVTWANGLCTQLHQGEFQASSLRVHVEQAAEQLATYGFTVAIQFNQFNESECPIG